MVNGIRGGCRSDGKCRSRFSAFGEGSFRCHVELGCVPLEIPDASTLHRDVDTADQLDAAAALGLGPRKTGERA